VGTTRTIAAASLTALLLLGGCGGDDSESASSTTVGATTTTVAVTTTTRSAGSLRAALLRASDVPGSTESPSEEGDADLRACFPGNPLGIPKDPKTVSSPDLDLTDGDIRRNFTSSARAATPQQAEDYVTTFGSRAGSACVLEAFKADLAAPPDPVDASDLTGRPSSVAVGDKGSLVTITGSLAAGTETVPLNVELLVFHKDEVVVFLTAAAFAGPLVPGQGLELAEKVAGRLS